jgi:gas vesicle protein
LKTPEKAAAEKAAEPLQKAEAALEKATKLEDLPEAVEKRLEQAAVESKEATESAKTAAKQEAEPDQKMASDQANVTTKKPTTHWNEPLRKSTRP